MNSNNIFFDSLIFLSSCLPHHDLLNSSEVLKLVNHPNIIRMEGLYESRTYLYIVMEMLTGGELFERIVGRPRYDI